MLKEKLLNLIRIKKTLLCVGLDFDLLNLGNKIPSSICLDLINKTIDSVIMYKINLAFFELCNIDVDFVCDYIHQRGSMVIIDGKRGDIGSTSRAYKKVLDRSKADGCTLNPYMGFDSVSPFLDDKDKFSILLGLTSNPGSFDFQKLKLENGLELWEEVVNKSLTWSDSDNLWFVFGGNRIKEIDLLRKGGCDNFLLIPGIGYQGGELEKVLEVGLTKDYGLVFNSSRSIILSDNPKSEVNKIKQNLQSLF